MERTKKSVVLNLPVEISADQFEALKTFTGEQDPTQKTSAIAKFLLTQYASGGMMVPQADVSAIEKALGAELKNSKQLIDMALKGVNRDDGQYSFRVQVDPSYIEPASEVAQAQGLTLEAFFSEFVSYCMGNDWVYSFAPSGYVARFSAEDQAIIEEFVGKQRPFGADIAKALLKVLPKKAVA